jgi:regulator of RNase E activity RraA
MSSTAAISDALDSLELRGSLHGIGPLGRGPLGFGQRTAGPVFTVKYEPIDATGGTVGDFLDDVEPGSVILIDNDGRTDCTAWGDIGRASCREREPKKR